MDVVGDLLTRDRRSREPALVTADGRERTYHDLITNAYKATNVLRYLGAREGSIVAVTPRLGLHTTLAFLGAAKLGCRVRFDAASGIEAGDRVVFVSAGSETSLDPPPGTNLVVYGGPPDRPGVTHWEQALWSENPGTPPSAVDPDDPVIVSNAWSTDTSHAHLLSAARWVNEEYALHTGSRVVVREPLHPAARNGTMAFGIVAAGIVAPLLAGGTIVLVDTTAGKSAGSDREVGGDVVRSPDFGSSGDRWDGDVDVDGTEDGTGVDGREDEAAEEDPNGDLAIVEASASGGPASVPEPQRLPPSALAHLNR